MSGKSRLKYLELDGIRGFAFLIVLMGHTLTTNTNISPYISGVPKVGVWVFFVLSSFLLTNYFLSKPERVQEPIEWGNYFLRRFLRIFPVYALVLCIYWIWNQDIKTLGDIKNNLFLLKQGQIHFWTMPVEITYYGILPFVVLFIVYICRMNVIFTLLSLTLLIAVNQYYYPFNVPVYNWVYGIHFLPVFVFGSVGALIHQRISSKELGRKQQNALDAIGVLTLLVFILVMPYPMHILFGFEPNGFLKEKFMLIGLGSIILILTALHGRLIKAIFSFSILRFFGKISYSGYLIHWLVIQAVISPEFTGLTITSAVSSLLLTTVLSTIMYYLVERHFIKINILKFKKEKKLVLTAQ
jgi:peptidoglycan/LPS O-acetylase OafA/YrhL